MPSVLRRFATPQNLFERPSQNDDMEMRAPVVLMVSGGADSTALLLLAAESELDIDDGRGLSRIARERLHVLHVNHQLRAGAAEEDESFVRRLSEDLGIPCTVCSQDVAAFAREQAGGSSNVENVGRELRYQAASKLANELCAKAAVPRSAARILTAHTADDRAETFFMNAIRGTGAPGLSSIPRRRNRIVRPLLDRTHQELCDLLRMRDIQWREDASNLDTHYLRSYVRHEVMPPIKARNPQVVGALSTTCDILADEDAFLSQLAARSYRELVRREGPSMLALDARRLGACELALARRVVRKALLAVCPEARLEARHVNGVLRLVAAGHGSLSVPVACDVRVEYGLLFIRVQGDCQGLQPAWLEVPGSLPLPDGRVLSARLQTIDDGRRADQLALAHGREWQGKSVLLDAQACGLDLPSGGRLWVDAPTPGDVLCPLGMRGQSKKLSDLLAQARVPAAERSGVAVVRSSPMGAVVWVAGIRPDERVRCQPATKLLLELSILKK